MLLRLLQLSFYDFSQFDHDDVDEQGLFALPDYGRFCRDPGHDAWLLRIGQKPAGFALIDLQSPRPDGAGRHDVHEFHVLRAYRGKGFGTQMAVSLFDRYPGGWQIEQIGPNTEAQAFWRRTIDRYTGGRFSERIVQGRRFPLVIQEFDTADRARDALGPDAG